MTWGVSKVVRNTDRVAVESNGVFRDRLTMKGESWLARR